MSIKAVVIMIVTGIIAILTTIILGILKLGGALMCPGWMVFLPLFIFFGIEILWCIGWLVGRYIYLRYLEKHETDFDIE